MTSVKKAPEVLLALLQQAIVLHNQQKLDEADAIYVKVLARVPRHADALHLRALICHARDQFAEAARFVPLERLAISPQCGFATSIGGNAITPADQFRKMRVLAETAQAVWQER